MGPMMPAGTSHELIFRHHGDARAATSVVLVGVVAALIGSVFIAIGPKFNHDPRASRDTRVGEVPAPVRVVGHAPSKNVLSSKSGRISISAVSSALTPQRTIALCLRQNRMTSYRC